MRRWQRIVLAAGIFAALAGGVSAAEPFYLNGDRMLPEIQALAMPGAAEESVTGLFMDLTTIKVENVFEDGLACEVATFSVAGGKETGRGELHIRYSVDGKSWVRDLSGQWREIPAGSQDPAALAVQFIRASLADDTLRDALVAQIDAIAQAKKDNLGKVAPEGAVPLTEGQPAEETPAAGGEEKPSPAQNPGQGDKGDVQVTITEAPKVEITPAPPVEVNIT